MAMSGARIFTVIVALASVAAVSFMATRIESRVGAAGAGRSVVPLCPGVRATALKVPGIEGAKAIAFQRGHLVVLDGKGVVWSYFVENAATCETRAVPMDRVASIAMARIASSAEVGVGLTADRKVAVWEPREGHPFCAAGLTGEACGASARHAITDGRDVAHSASHLLVALNDGSVLSAGMNDCGQLGRTAQRSPPQASSLAPVPGLSGVVAVAAGKRSSMALDGSGKVWVWGNLSHPLVGSATPSQPTLNALYCGATSNPFGLSQAPDTTPRVVSGLPAVAAIASFHGFDLALDKRGRVWGWGYNDCGQIGGDPAALASTFGFQATPAPISGLPPISAMAAGRRHALFVGVDGSVWSTGDNGFAQLGTQEALVANSRLCLSSITRAAIDASSAKPIRVGGIPPAVAVAADDGHSAALDTEGHVWLWGRYP